MGRQALGQGRVPAAARPRPLLALLLSTAALPWPMPATGQALSEPPADTVAAPDPDPDPEPVATQGVWAEDVWLDLLDREGTVRGRLAEEGVFQRFHPLMDDEYELDRRTGLFTAAEDVAWHGSEAALRGAGASVSHPHILNRVDWSCHHAAAVRRPGLVPRNGSAAVGFHRRSGDRPVSRKVP